MPTQAAARQTKIEAAPSGLEFYRTRDEMVRAYQPQTEEERLLVTQMARAWLRLQQFYEFEAKVLQAGDLLDLFTNDLERYKLLARGIAEAERQWRNAVQLFDRARRRNAQPPAPAARPQSRPNSIRSVPFSSVPAFQPISDVYNSHEEPKCSSAPRQTVSTSTAGPSS